MSNNYRHYDYRSSGSKYSDVGTWRWEPHDNSNGSGSSRRDAGEKKDADKCWKITTEMPILDLLSLFVGIISLAITIFIATGIIGIHQTVQNIDEDNDDDNNNGSNNNNGNKNNSSNIANKTTSNANASSKPKTHANASLLTDFETKIADWFNRRNCKD